MKSYPTSIRSALLAAAFVFSLSAGLNAHAQAQSLLSQNGVVIAAVEPLLSADGNGGAIAITGINFPRSPRAGYPVVSLRLAGGNVTTLTSQYDGATVLALLPQGLSTTAPGSYRVMVSFGPGTNVTDSFEFTIGAVGLTGAKGDKGDKGDTGAQGPRGFTGDQGIQGAKGDKGDKGDQGAQGMKGDKGDRGEQGASGVTGLSALPIFQNKPAALAAGLRVGDFWIQQNTGHVYRVMDLDPGYGNGGN
ncbi:MAG: collagen-like protein [Candidatus Didemnitutus sp.]|nr:collagen-like protein [Candidatus Didemnitutus sp.]